MPRFSRDAWLALVAILALAFNLRPVAASIGPVLTHVVADTGMGGFTAGLLTALPTLSFSIFGALAPRLSRAIGPHWTVLVALLALITGQLGRSAVTGAWAFIALTVLALSGMALANVLMPTLVRIHFPQRIGLATSLYSVTLTIGQALTSVGMVPLARQLGGWRAAFAASAITAVAALLVWLPLLRGRSAWGEAGRGRSGPSLTDVARTRMGWMMALLFGLQSGHAYSIFGWLPTIYADAGLGELEAGLMLGITTGVGIIPAFVLPAWTARHPTPVGVFLSLMACLAGGYLGLWLAPLTAPWLWAILLAAGTATFPMILALLGLRATTPEGTAALSGFTQSAGYLVATVMPFTVGALHSLSPTWTVPLLVLLALTVPMTLVGLVVIRREWAVEDELARTVGKAPQEPAERE